MAAHEYSIWLWNFVQEACVAAAMQAIRERHSNAHSSAAGCPLHCMNK